MNHNKIRTLNNLVIYNITLWLERINTKTNIIRHSFVILFIFGHKVHDYRDVTVTAQLWPFDLYFQQSWFLDVTKLLCLIYESRLVVDIWPCKEIVTNMNGLNIIDAQKCTDKKNLNVIIDN